MEIRRAFSSDKQPVWQIMKAVIATGDTYVFDPETPEEERERRIHRLTDGPPEFVDFRVDLPGRRPH